jgi:hypothetical protein
MLVLAASSWVSVVWMVQQQVGRAMKKMPWLIPVQMGSSPTCCHCEVNSLVSSFFIKFVAQLANYTLNQTL